MYLDFFGLSEPPFSITPDTGFYYSNPDHQAALNMLLVAVRSGESFIKVVGEVGTGKTLLCRMLLAELEGRYATAWLPNPQMSAGELRRALAEELGMEDVAGDSEHTLGKRLAARMVELHAQGKPVVLLVDEAQALDREGLEAIRLLTNLETEKRKLLQVVLLGQPELDARLADPRIRQLRQRIVFSHRLHPLDRRGTRDYLNHRLRQAGYNGPALFSPAAVRQLQRASGGIPRLINILAHKALIHAYGRGERRIGRRHIRRAVADTEGVRAPGHSPTEWVLLSVILLALVGIGLMEWLP